MNTAEILKRFPEVVSTLKVLETEQELMRKAIDEARSNVATHADRIFELLRVLQEYGIRSLYSPSRKMYHEEILEACFSHLEIKTRLEFFVRLRSEEHTSELQ